MSDNKKRKAESSANGGMGYYIPSLLVYFCIFFPRFEFKGFGFGSSAQGLAELGEDIPGLISSHSEKETTAKRISSKSFFFSDTPSGRIGFLPSPQRSHREAGSYILFDQRAASLRVKRAHTVPADHTATKNNKK